MERRSLKVIHDFDNAYPSGKDSFNRGLKLIIYSMSKKIHFLKRFCKSIYDENCEYAFTVYKLDALLNLTSRFGINTRVQPFFPHLKEELESMGAVVHDHWHVSPDPHWEVHWKPELPFDVPITHRYFDQLYSKDHRVSSDDVLCFHVDRPNLLPAYIDCLYQLLVKQNA